MLCLLVFMSGFCGPGEFFCAFCVRFGVCGCVCLCNLFWTNLRFVGQTKRETFVDARGWVVLLNVIL